MNERIIALDVGDRRIGIAVSDPLGYTAQPIETYTRVGYGPDTRHILAPAASIFHFGEVSIHDLKMQLTENGITARI